MSRNTIAGCLIAGWLSLLVTCDVAVGQVNQLGTDAIEQSNGEPQLEVVTQLHMRAKLANAQMVLEGLVTEDFSLIADGAKQMKRIARAAHWPTTVDEAYQHYSFEFRRQCDKLAQQAEKNDLQAAHYTYLHMSTMCIDCHNYVRGNFRIEKKKPNGPVRLIPTEWDGPIKKIPAPQPDT